ncbi:uncharacterized protein LOC110986943 isoform X1 [Acanthaster planci]|uniref:Uncharacterized protein LOC110986943 isoform X1 n=1 Tax=Acanthaster planci TaxID=133434 RepID=A0A8B7ZH62_ACAPL|nr:uncharacterized protein LOC110986943 isoform X1 [Acanthaster planci]
MEFSPRVEAYSEDAAHLGEMLGLFRTECVDYLEGRHRVREGGYDNAKGWVRTLDDGRYCLTQFPHGHAETLRSLMSQQPADVAQAPRVGDRPLRPAKALNFVGFLGRRSDQAAQLMAQADKLVDDLMVLMCDQPDVLLYGTAGWSPEDSNHYNLVVLRNEEAGQKWKEGELHMREAINNLSPKYYTTVRIHTGVLPDGLDSKEFLLKRSVFLDYRAHQKDPNAPIQREVKLWENLPASSVEGDDRNQ